MHPVFAPHFKKPAGLFGLIAARYMVKNNSFVYEGIERFAGFAEGQDVLEIGFGPGVGLGYLLERYRLRMAGIDFSPLMVRKAARRNRASIKEGRLTLLQGDILTDGSWLGAFDRVIFANVLYFWDDLDAAFRAIKDRLRPGGRLVFYMSSEARLKRKDLTSAPAFKHYGNDEVLAGLSRAGFEKAAINAIVDGSGDFLIVSAEA